MARFYGKIGFAVMEETRPGIFEEVYKEQSYKGDILKSSRRWEPTEHLNDDLSINNDISVVADSFMKSHFGAMRYVYWMDQCFEIVSATVDTERHRVTLSLGGPFNAGISDRDSEITNP